MALPEFEYFRPDSLQEAVGLLQRYSGGAKLLAGGQTLLPLLSMRLARPDAVVDLGGIDELRGIAAHADGVRIGALTRHVEVEGSELLSACCPLLPAAARMIGHSHIRNRGTIGGSIAHADPAAEYPVALLALEGAIELAGPAGRRTVPAADFFLGTMVTAAWPEEVLTAVRVPNLSGGTGWACQEMVLRSGDFALVCVAAVLTVVNGQIDYVRVAVGGAGPVATRMRRTEAVLLGQAPGPAAWEIAGHTASAEIEAVTDATATAEYRQAITRIYVAETLAAAAARLEV